MIVTWSPGDPAAFMPEALLTELAGLVRRHPWWRARSKLVLALLQEQGITPPARVLDAGCGWGTTLEALEVSGYDATGLDVSRQALERLDRPTRRLIEADLSQPFAPPPGNLPSFDAVLALDVIEHLDDDRAALRRLGQLVRPGGVLVVSVPALPELYSPFDAVQGHRRRYDLDGLHATLDASGLAGARLFWWGGWLVPIFQMTRRRRARPAPASAETVYRRHLELPPWPVPWLFERAFAWEQGRALRGELGQGTSLVALAVVAGAGAGVGTGTGQPVEPAGAAGCWALVS